MSITRNDKSAISIFRKQFVTICLQPVCHFWPATVWSDPAKSDRHNHFMAATRAAAVAAVVAAPNASFEPKAHNVFYQSFTSRSMDKYRGAVVEVRQA